MRVLLAYPPCLHPRVNDPDAGVVPMGLYSIGAVLLKAGHEVRVENLNSSRDNVQAIGSLLRDFSPDLVGLSVLNANRWGAVAVCRMVRALLPGCKTVFGGVGATFLWHFFLDHFPEIDFAVLGEGEQTMLLLVQALEAGKNPDLDDIPGLAFRTDSGPSLIPPGPLIRDLDSLPDPSRHFAFQHLALSRGCPGRCTFCGSPRFWQGRVRFHSPSRFVDQMENQVGRGIRFFYVSDDTFTLDRNRALAVCREILDRDLDVTWFAISRVDRVDPELLAWMRRAGCIQISYGVESGSDFIRNEVLGKGVSRQDIVNAFVWTQASGILARAYFIYGSPGETEATIEESIDLIRDIKPLGLITYSLHLYPGTDLFDRLAPAHGLTDQTWLTPVEDILLAQLAPEPGEKTVLTWGRKLRRVWHSELPDFARALEFAPDDELRPFQADLCSRLGLTLAFGDLAREDIPDREDTAEYLFSRALDLCPDRRAFLGLGMLWQRSGRTEESMKILDRGLTFHDQDMDLCLCQAVNLLGLGRNAEAAILAEPFADSPRGTEILKACRRTLG